MGRPVPDPGSARGVDERLEEVLRHWLQHSSMYQLRMPLAGERPALLNDELPDVEGLRWQLWIRQRAAAPAPATTMDRSWYTWDVAILADEQNPRDHWVAGEAVLRLPLWEADRG